MQAVPKLVKWWKYSEDNPELVQAAYPKCHGVYQRGVCVFGVEDLGWILAEGHHLFANKFDLKSDSLALTCLGEWLFNKTIAQALAQELA